MTKNFGKAERVLRKRNIQCWEKKVLFSQFAHNLMHVSDN